MPPDTQADGPGGPKARRTRGPASPGQRTAQPFGGTLNASPPALCAGGLGLPRAFGRHSAGRRTRGASAPRGGSAAHAARCTPGISVLAGVPRPMRAAVHAGHRPSRAFRRPPAVRRRTRGLGLSRAFRGPPYTRGLGPRGRSAAHAARRTRGASAPAGVPQVSRRPPPHTGPQPSQAFRRPPAVRRPRGASATRGRSAGLPQAFTTRGASALAAHAALAGVSQAARARSQPAPAARFSRKPPCGIGSRMVYCT